MTKEEFQNLEAICKFAWEELGENGENRKPDYLGDFLNRCPACHIAYLAENSVIQNCKLCPIDIWRKKAKVKNIVPGWAVCEQREELFRAWIFTSSPEERKSFAKKIAKLKWSYLKAYERIEDGKQDE